MKTSGLHPFSPATDKQGKKESWERWLTFSTAPRTLLYRQKYVPGLSYEHGKR